MKCFSNLELLSYDTRVYFLYFCISFFLIKLILNLHRINYFPKGWSERGGMRRWKREGDRAEGKVGTDDFLVPSRLPYGKWTQNKLVP